ncbi:glycosyltransferase family 39 protein [Rhizophagus clarus]|uniref:Glycosyltransferase family 39 protein n=1 Tax=Rhizophagus clarus TaxID=94130 RepID=A0A8H3LHN9_9GLOM|nr:glycosyltransferase family 39 protein [Rhizophagus clarus]
MVCFHSIQPMEQVIFNTGPLYIGNDLYTGITGQINDFRYFNWRLSADEVTNDYLNKNIGVAVGASFGSILLFVTGFYLIRSYKKRQKQNRAAYYEISGNQVISSGK